MSMYYIPCFVYVGYDLCMLVPLLLIPSWIEYPVIAVEPCWTLWSPTLPTASVSSAEEHEIFHAHYSRSLRIRRVLGDNCSPQERATARAI